jgi:lipoate-protein ligase A
LYESVHRGILGWLEHWNVAAQLHENSPSPARPTEDAMPAEPFLCFQRRTSKDIVIGPHKIAGSAQRRQGNLVWQHGSILWQTSAHAPEMPGIVDLEPSREWTMERRTASRKLLQCIEQATALEFSIQWRSDQIGTERVEHWIVHRFSAADWNEKR